MALRRSPLPPWLRAALLAAAAGLASCGGSDDPSPPPPDARGSDGPGATRSTPTGARAPSRERTPWRVEDLPELLGANLPRGDEAGQAEGLRREPEDDDWESEKLVARAQPALEGLLAAVLGPVPATPEALSPWLAEPFEGATALVPEALSITYEDASTRVREPQGGALDALQPAGVEALAGSAAALRELLGGAGARALPLVVSFEQRGPAAFDTRVVLFLDGQDGAAPVQIDATWDLGWALSAEAGPRIRSLRLARWQEVRAEAPLLAEVTDAVFGSLPFWRSEFLRGIDDWFMRIDRQAGIAFQGMQGLAVGDVDGDGLEDVYVCQQVGLPNRLLVRRPDGGVDDRAAEGKVDYLDVTRSALIVDLDNDGARDLVLALGANVVVAYNDGAGVFERQTVLEVEGAEQFYSLSAADADGDGDLDLYGCRYALGGVMHGAPTPYHDADNGATNYYWRNDGVGRFTDATGEAGFDANNRKFSLATIWEDLDRDGILDLYVVNDFGRNNFWKGDGRGHFVDRAAEHGLVDIGAGMGATCADYDLDGDVDLYVTNMFSAPGLRLATQERFLRGRHPEERAWYVKHASGNTLLAGRDDGTYEDVTAASGVGLGRWAWGAKFVDFNADGYADLYVPNGQTTSLRDPFDLEGYFWRRVIDQSPIDPSTIEGYRTAFDAIQNMMMFEGQSWNGNERNDAYLNLGDGRFVEAGHVLGAAFVEDSRCFVTLDWDDDGRDDVLLKGRTAPRLRLLLGRDRSGHHSVSFELVGRRCNRDAIGALVTVTAGGRSQARRVYAGDGYLTQSSTRLVFGLGAAQRVERVEVRWPDGSSSSYADLAAGRRWRLDQGQERAEEVTLRPVARLAGLPSVHAERDPLPVDRVVLADRLPMGPFRLPAFQGEGRPVSELEGQPLLIHFWTAAHESGRAALAELSAAAPELARSGLQVACLSVDEGLDLARARKAIGETPFAALGGYADGRTREALSVFVLEVLGFFDRVPVPTSLLLDAGGQLAVLYPGPADPLQIAADAVTLAGMNPRARATTKLSGGRWLRPARRGFATMAQVFSALGFEELAGFYQERSGSAARPGPR